MAEFLKRLQQEKANLTSLQNAASAAAATPVSATPIVPTPVAATQQPAYPYTKPLPGPVIFADTSAPLVFGGLKIPEVPEVKAINPALLGRKPVGLGNRPRVFGIVKQEPDVAPGKQKKPEGSVIGSSSEDEKLVAFPTLPSDKSPSGTSSSTVGKKSKKADPEAQKKAAAKAEEKRQKEEEDRLERERKLEKKRKHALEKHEQQQTRISEKRRRQEAADEEKKRKQEEKEKKQREAEKQRMHELSAFEGYLCGSVQVPDQASAKALDRLLKPLEERMKIPHGEMNAVQATLLKKVAERDVAGCVDWQVVWKLLSHLCPADLNVDPDGSGSFPSLDDVIHDFITLIITKCTIVPYQFGAGEFDSKTGDNYRTPSLDNAAAIEEYLVAHVSVQRDAEAEPVQKKRKQPDGADVPPHVMVTDHSEVAKMHPVYRVRAVLASLAVVISKRLFLPDDAFGGGVIEGATHPLMIPRECMSKDICTLVEEFWAGVIATISNMENLGALLQQFHNDTGVDDSEGTITSELEKLYEGCENKHDKCPHLRHVLPNGDSVYEHTDLNMFKRLVNSTLLPVNYILRRVAIPACLESQDDRKKFLDGVSCVVKELARIMVEFTKSRPWRTSDIAAEKLEVKTLFADIVTLCAEVERLAAFLGTPETHFNARMCLFNDIAVMAAHTAQVQQLHAMAAKYRDWLQTRACCSECSDPRYAICKKCGTVKNAEVFFNSGFVSSADLESFALLLICQSHSTRTKSQLEQFDFTKLPLYDPESKVNAFIQAVLNIDKQLPVLLKMFVFDHSIESMQDLLDQLAPLYGLPKFFLRCKQEGKFGLSASQRALRIAYESWLRELGTTPNMTADQKRECNKKRRNRFHLNIPCDSCPAVICTCKDRYRYPGENVCNSCGKVLVPVTCRLTLLHLFQHLGVDVYKVARPALEAHFNYRYGEARDIALQAIEKCKEKRAKLEKKLETTPAEEQAVLKSKIAHRERQLASLESDVPNIDSGKCHQPYSKAEFLKTLCTVEFTYVIFLKDLHKAVCEKGLARVAHGIAVHLTYIEQKFADSLETKQLRLEQLLKDLANSRDEELTFGTHLTAIKTYLYGQEKIKREHIDATLDLVEKRRSVASHDVFCNTIDRVRKLLLACTVPLGDPVFPNLRGWVDFAIVETGSTDVMWQIVQDRIDALLTRSTMDNKGLTKAEEAKLEAQRKIREAIQKAEDSDRDEVMYDKYDTESSDDEGGDDDDDDDDDDDYDPWKEKKSRQRKCSDDSDTGSDADADTDDGDVMDVVEVKEEDIEDDLKSEGESGNESDTSGIYVSDDSAKNARADAKRRRVGSQKSSDDSMC